MIMRKALGAIAILCLLGGGIYGWWQGGVSSASAQQLRGIDYVNATSGNVAAGVATATLAATTNRQQFFTGFEITYGGNTAGGPCVVATLTGLLGGTESFIVCPPVGAGVAGVPIIVQQTTPLPANVNTAIVLTIPSLGAGNLFVVANLHGYVFQQ